MLVKAYYEYEILGCLIKKKRVKSLKTKKELS
jgi:hypothetical protein